VLRGSLYKRIELIRDEEEGREVTSKQFQSGVKAMGKRVELPETEKRNGQSGTETISLRSRQAKGSSREECGENRRSLKD